VLQENLPMSRTRNGASDTGMLSARELICGRDQKLDVVAALGARDVLLALSAAGRELQVLLGFTPKLPIRVAIHVVNDRIARLRIKTGPTRMGHVAPLPTEEMRTNPGLNERNWS